MISHGNHDAIASGRLILKIVGSRNLVSGQAEKPRNRRQALALFHPMHSPRCAPLGGVGLCFPESREVFEERLGAVEVGMTPGMGIEGALTLMLRLRRG